MKGHSLPPIPSFLDFGSGGGRGFFDIRGKVVDFVLDFELSRDYWVLLLVLLATYVIISIVYAILNLVYRSIRPLLIVALIAFAWPVLEKIATSTGVDVLFKYLAYVIKSVIVNVVNFLMHL